jgi:hypothetical protein
MAEFLKFLEIWKCEFENKGIFKSQCFWWCEHNDHWHTNDELVVQGTCYFGKHKYVWTRICQTKCNKKSYSNHVWTWTHQMFLSMCHCVALKLTIWIRGQFLSFAIPTKLIEFYDWIKGEHCVFWIWW